MSGGNIGTAGQFPVPETPFVGPNGQITLPWFYFLQNQYRRTGGTSAGGSAVPVVIGTNPMVYTPQAAGTLFISGGGVSRLRITRDAVTYIDAGSH